MRWTRLTLLVSCFFIAGTWADQTPEAWTKFKNRSQDYYYYLSDSHIMNFTCLFTTDTYITFINEIADSSYRYPIKFIWTDAGKMYFVLQPYPDITNQPERSRMMEEIQFVKKQFEGFYLDWHNFLIQSPFDDIPDTADLIITPDSIRVSFTSGEKGKEARVSKVFLPSGKLVKVSVQTPGRKVVNYPRYREWKGKWVCVGWDSQIYQKGVIISGLSTSLELQRVQEQWMPVRVNVVVQTTEKPGEHYYSDIFLKDYLFDVPLQEIQPPAKESPLRKESHDEGAGGD